MEECENCKMWDSVAKEKGYQSAICGQCYDKNFVSLLLSYKPNECDFCGGDCKCMLRQKNPHFAVKS